MNTTHHCETCTCGKWVLKAGETYFSIDSVGTIASWQFHDGFNDRQILSFGNVFRTKEAAQKALEAIIKVLQEAEKG